MHLECSRVELAIDHGIRLEEKKLTGDWSCFVGHFKMAGV